MKIRYGIEIDVQLWQPTVGEQLAALIQRDAGIALSSRPVALLLKGPEQRAGDVGEGPAASR